MKASISQASSALSSECYVLIGWFDWHLLLLQQEVQQEVQRSARVVSRRSKC